MATTQEQRHGDGVELIDVITADGLPTGVRKPKSEIHRDGDWHRTAHVWIVTPDGRVLLQRRSETKDNYAGFWDVSAAGHVSAGESVVVAAIREVGEELGIDLTGGELREIGRVRESVIHDGGRYIDNEMHTVFVVERAIDPAALRIDPEEVAEVELVAADDLAARIGHDLKLVPHPDEYELLWNELGRLRKRRETSDR